MFVYHEQKIFKMDMGKSESGSVWGGPHYFISLGAQKGHNLARVKSTTIERRGLQWANFGGHIDREAVARMSGRHQMISLRDLIS